MKKYQYVLVLLFIITAALAGPADARKLRDDLGRTVLAPDRPRRIICLTPSLTEIVFALERGEAVVGATTWAQYPPAAKHVTRVGSYIAPNLEQIVALQPDLVLADWVGTPPQTVQGLERAGLAVYVTRSDDPQTLPRQLAALGSVCGVPEMGRRLADRCQQQLNQVLQRVGEAALVRTLMVIGHRPLISAGDDTLHGRLLKLLRATNIAGRAPGHWPRLSMEFVLREKPELVVLTTMQRDQGHPRRLLEWQNMPGLKNRADYRVASIESDLIDRAGPRLGLGIEKLARCIHPECFTPEAGPQ